jgi:diadenosine tetraphosphatase ApaH/serine/threonine PP2A family protein phosphatase
VVGYGPDPNGCVELLRDLSHLCIAGNHDWATLGKLDLDDFNEDARRANQWNREQLTTHNLRYLDNLPETIVNGQFTLAHGSPRQPIWEYILHTSTAQANFDHFDTVFCLVGHTHTPVIYRLGNEGEPKATPRHAAGASCEALLPSKEAFGLGPERLIINPGSVGQPRDGNPQAGYAILDMDSLTIEHRRVSYPVEKTQAKMVKHALPTRLVMRLSLGW